MILQLIKNFFWIKSPRSNWSKKIEMKKIKPTIDFFLENMDIIPDDISIMGNVILYSSVKIIKKNGINLYILYNKDMSSGWLIYTKKERQPYNLTHEYINKRDLFKAVLKKHFIKIIL